MAPPRDFEAMLSVLSGVFAEYHRVTGARAILVGGAAVSIYTRGRYISGDFDIVASANEAFDIAMRRGAGSGLSFAENSSGGR